jgi:hypothetical protein
MKLPVPLEALLLLIVGLGALFLGWGPRLAILLIALGVWLVAYRLLSAAEGELTGKLGKAYRLLQKFQIVAKQKSQLLLLLAFFLVSYFFWLFTGRILGSFLLSVFLFSAGTLTLEKRGRFAAGDLLFPLIFLFGAVYSFLRGL